MHSTPIQGRKKLHSNLQWSLPLHHRHHPHNQEAWFILPWFVLYGYGTMTPCTRLQFRIWLHRRHHPQNQEAWFILPCFVLWFLNCDSQNAPNYILIIREHGSLCHGLSYSFWTVTSCMYQVTIQSTSGC